MRPDYPDFGFPGIPTGRGTFQDLKQSKTPHFGQAGAVKSPEIGSIHP